jgi:hypothetical protein
MVGRKIMDPNPVFPPTRRKIPSFEPLPKREKEKKKNPSQIVLTGARV